MEEAEEETGSVQEEAVLGVRDLGVEVGPAEDLEVWSFFHFLIGISRTESPNLCFHILFTLVLKTNSSLIWSIIFFLSLRKYEG